MNTLSETEKELCRRGATHRRVSGDDKKFSCYRCRRLIDIGSLYRLFLSPIPGAPSRMEKKKICATCLMKG